jgi:lipopolysaccharide/colanic/teichoic acid biosynthesis glycosyltransferase
MSAGLAIILFPWWATLIAWIAVKLSSTGQGFFAQDCVGRNGEAFKYYKLRSMEVGTKHAGTHEVDKDSVFRVGLFLRKWKLDELPQAINLLKGEVNLVGPRPCLFSQGAVVEERRKLGVFEIGPGIAGLMQVADIDISTLAKLAQSDAEYMAKQSIILDIKIMLRTLIERGVGDRLKPPQNDGTG